jgi:hypothetical protein
LRYDAEPEQPGWISTDGKSLYVRRGSCVHLHADLAELLCAMRHWQARIHSESPWFFPSPVDPSRHIPVTGLCRALNRLPVIEGCPRLSCAGLRAYYVSTRLCRGASCEIIGRELGVNLPRQDLEQMYAPFAGSKDFTFTSQEPAWLELLGYNSDSDTASLGSGRGRLIDRVYGIVEKPSQKLLSTVPNRVRRPKASKLNTIFYPDCASAIE